jgi:hypothetical protein
LDCTVQDTVRKAIATSDTMAMQEAMSKFPKYSRVTIGYFFRHWHWAICNDLVKDKYDLQRTIFHRFIFAFLHNFARTEQTAIFRMLCKIDGDFWSNRTNTQTALKWDDCSF